MILYSALYKSQDPFDLCKEVVRVTHPLSLKKGGMLLLHGGEDISPSIYNQAKNNYCYATDAPSKRDKIEMEMIAHAKHLGMPIVGICRGAQLLCAFDGGTLLQHIENHTGRGHFLTDTNTQEEVYSNSCHHQMCIPRLADGNKVLAYAQEHSVRGVGEYDKELTITQVPEIVYYKELNAIGIQGHPEWMHGTPFVAYCKALIKQYLLKD
jgi:gamma-glutamyl-gamma-aminobutyrate hydrolase PuuD